MDRYEHCIGKLAGFFFGKGKPYAITLGQTTYYSCYAYQVSDKWRKHEDEHKKQWKEDGKIKFTSRYLWQWVTKDSIDY